MDNSTLSPNKSEEQICCPICLKEYAFADVEFSYLHFFEGSKELIFVGLCLECREPVVKEPELGCQGPAQRLEENIPKFSKRWVSAASEVAMIVHDGNFKAAITPGGLLRPLEAKTRYTACRGRLCRRLRGFPRLPLPSPDTTEKTPLTQTQQVRL